MLGIIKTASSWKWAAFGKHPLAGDYFFSGPDDSLFRAFSAWINNGYKRIGASRKNAKDLYSWRFCGKGLTSDTLLCGIGRDSYDCHGRPYPLYIMGAGPLSGYPKHWDLLPFAFENLWSQMEYLCNKRYIDFAQLEADVQRLPTPENRWPMFEADRKNRWDLWCSQTPPDDAKIRKVLQSHTGTPQFLIPLIEDTSPDTVSTMGLWLSILKKEEKAMFGTAFFGGNVSKPCLAVFRRPLGTEDFVQLWSDTASPIESF